MEVTLKITGADYDKTGRLVLIKGIVGEVDNELVVYEPISEYHGYLQWSVPVWRAVRNELIERDKVRAIPIYSPYDLKNFFC